MRLLHKYNGPAEYLTVAECQFAGWLLFFIIVNVVRTEGHRIQFDPETAATSIANDARARGRRFCC